MKATVVHERLVNEYGFTGNYQRVKLYLQEARPRIAEELGLSLRDLARLHRRFEVVPGAQAQVDWGDEGAILAHAGIAKVYSFHMPLSYSRDPFVNGHSALPVDGLEISPLAATEFGSDPIVVDHSRSVA